jgi:hypothetical protein
VPQCFSCKYMQFVYSRRKQKLAMYCTLLKTTADSDPDCAQFVEYDKFDRYL